MNSLGDLPVIKECFKFFEKFSNLSISLLKSEIATNYEPDLEEMCTIPRDLLPTHGISKELKFLGAHIVLKESDDSTHYTNDNIKTLKTKVEKFTNTFKKLYLQQCGLERSSKVYSSTDHIPSTPKNNSMIYKKP